MIVEQPPVRIVLQPWGSTDLGPWSKVHRTGAAVGELWFERGPGAEPDNALLLKLLFTSEPVSIQVHPDDTFARSIGLAHGKTVAWYILSAAPGALVGVGLKRRLTVPELRASIEDGSIASQIAWVPVKKDDVVFVPAGAIHAIGSGLVVAEIEFGCDATFRLFDPGRDRELHVYNATHAAHPGPVGGLAEGVALGEGRTLLVNCPQFVLERIDLASGSTWTLMADHETWLLGLDGGAVIGQTEMSMGQAIYLESDHTDITIGPAGLRGLVAYAGGGCVAPLLQRTDRGLARQALTSEARP